MKKLLFVTVLLSICQLGFAQEFEVPAAYEMKTLEDYARYQPMMVDCINWLENTPVNEQTEKRKAANKFLLQWVTGTDYVSMEIHADMIKHSDKNAQLLLVFLGGWAKYALENPEDKNNQKMGNLAGLHSVIAFYQKNTAYLKKDRSVKKLIKLQEKEKLEEWVEERLSDA